MNNREISLLRTRLIKHKASLRIQMQFKKSERDNREIERNKRAINTINKWLKNG